MVKLYFPLALLLGQVLLKAGRCDGNSIWLFVSPPRTRYEERFTVSKVQGQKAKNHSV